MHVHVGGEWVAMYALAPTLLDTPDTPDTGPTLARHWPDTSDTPDTPTHQGSTAAEMSAIGLSDKSISRCMSSNVHISYKYLTVFMNTLCSVVCSVAALTPVSTHVFSQGVAVCRL